MNPDCRYLDTEAQRLTNEYPDFADVISDLAEKHKQTLAIEPVAEVLEAFRNEVVEMAKSLDEIQTLAHPFEVDLNCLVILNHTFTLQSIEHAEDTDSDDLHESLAGEDSEVIGSALRWSTIFYENLRRAARNMAVVGLVTRLEHWTEKFTQQAKVSKQSEHRSTLIRKLGDLNNYLGAEHVPIIFFVGLVDARDSVIHADSKAEWEHKGTRAVRKDYTNAYGELDVSENHLQEAIENVTKQVKWYDEQIAETEAKNCTSI